MKTIDDFLDEVEAGPIHDLAVWYMREHEGATLNDLYGFFDYMMGNNDYERV